MKSVKQTHQFPNNFSGVDWQILGTLELPVNSDFDHVVSRWLTNVLGPLDLHTDFLGKVLKSAQDAVAHAMQIEPKMALEHLHLLVFAPTNSISERRSWGFFRIEKVSLPTEKAKAYDHSIEFYLYLER